MATPYMEAVVEFVKNRSEEGVDMFPTLETVTDALTAIIAFMIGFLAWLWDHPMCETVGEHLKSCKEMLEDGLDNVREISAPYIESGLKFMKNRNEEGMEIFPTLETVMDTLKAFIAFTIGFFSWLWDHPMWETVGENLKSGKEMLEDGLVNVREISAPYIESGCLLGEHALTKAREMSGPLMDAAVEYSEMMVEAGKELVVKGCTSVAVYSGPVLESGKEAFEEALIKVTSFHEETDASGSATYFIMAFSSIIIIMILVGKGTGILSCSGDQPEVVEDDDEEEDDEFNY